MTRSRLFAGLLLLFFFSIAITAIGQKPEKHAYIDIPEAAWAKADPQVVVITRQVVVDYQCISAPGNPPAGLVRVYCDTSTGNLTCLTSSGASCISSGGGGTITGSGTSGTVTKFTSSTAVGNSSVTDDGTNPTQTPNGTTAVTNGFYRQIANANPGSTLNRAACLNSSAQAITCATNTTSGVAGIAGQGAGNSGNVQVCMMGTCTAEFDNQSTVGDWAILSTTTAGRLHDTGLTTETTGAQNFFVYSTNGGAGTTATVGILNPDVISGGSSGGGRGTNVQTNGTNAQPTLNLNSTTPAPGAGFLATTVASSNSGNTTSTIAKVPISGNTSTVASASTISGTTNLCGDGSGNVTSVGCTANALPGVTNITGTAYTLATTDNAKTVTVSNASPATITLPAPGGSAPIQQTVALTFLACTTTCASKNFTPTNTGDLVVISVESNNTTVVTGLTGITAGHTTFQAAGTTSTWGSGAGLTLEAVFYSFNTPNTADTYTPTITGTGAASTLTLHIMDYNNIQTSSNPKDVYVTANGTSPPPTTGNANTTANNELLIAVIAGTTCGIDSTLGSGYTSRVGTVSMASSGGIEDQVVAIPGTYVGNATNSSGCTAWGASVTSFKMTSGVSFPNGYYVTIQNTGASLVTIARGSANIDGVAANLVLQPNQGVLIVTDGTNWFTMRGRASQAGMVTAQQATLTTLANMPGLSFPVAASTKYVMSCTLYYQVSATTNNLTVAITGPSSPTFVSYSFFDTNTGTAIGASSVATAFATTLSGAGTSTATTNFPAFISMGLSNGANAGTVQVQAGSTGTGSSTVQTGSFCTLQTQP